MIDENIENRLTPAARGALDELVKDYRDQVLLAAVRSASDLTGEVKEISIRDILLGIEKNYLKIQSRKSRRREQYYKIAMFIGLIYMLLGIIMFFYQSENIMYVPKMSLIIVFVGFLTSLISYILLKKPLFESALQSFPKGKYDLYDKDLDLIFIKKWRQIELTLKDFISLKLGESKANAPISVIFNLLANKGIIEKEDYTRLRELIEIRNQILHLDKDFSKVDLNQAVNEADKILDKLRIAIGSS